MKAYVILEVWDKNGKLLKKHKEKCKSFLKNFAIALRSFICAEGGGIYPTVNLTDINGNTIQWPDDANLQFGNFALACNRGEINKGIVIGSGTTANTVDTYKLESILTSNLSVYSYSYTDIAVSDSTVSFKLQKKIINKGVTINVNEVGLYARVKDKNGQEKIVCIARDVLSETIQVQQDQNLVVEYEIKITVG